MRARGMEGFCWGVLVGSFIGNFLLPLLAVRSGGGLSIRFSVFHPGLKKYILVALPLMIGQSITVVDEQFVRIFGSLAGVGAISWLSYARRIMMVPVSVVAQAAGVASYPFMAELFVKNDLSRFYRTINSALQNVMTLLVPLSIWMILVAEPTIRLIFQQGRFGVSDTAHTARLLEILLICVPCWGYQQVLGRAFYSRLDTLTPAVLGTSVTLLMIPVFYLLTVRTGALGVACASAASLFCFSAALTFWWKARCGGAVFCRAAVGYGQSCSFCPRSRSCRPGPPERQFRSTRIFLPTWPPFLKSFLVDCASGSFLHSSPVILSRSWQGRSLTESGPIGRRLLRGQASGS